MESLTGGSFVDGRGKLSFINDFDFKNIKRFYVVQNHQKGFIRAWHGHLKEAKYVYVVTGAAIIGVVDMETEDAETYVLSEDVPEILCIPPGKYNGFKTLTDDTKVMFFSTATLEESKADDIREPSDKWRDLFEVVER